MHLISAEDVAIVVMGTTGAGKSSFVAQCTQDRTAIVGHNLLSCTTAVSVHTMVMQGRTVHLIDTPGFNDTLRSDGETLQELAYWLMSASEHGFRLSGIIFLHRITEPRFHGSAQRSLELFKAICGGDALCGTVVATTMWDRIASGDIELARSRQAQLRNKIHGEIISYGAKVIALSAGEVDARKVIRHILAKDLRLTLALQTELAHERRSLQDTGAGKILYGDILRSFESVENSLDGSIREATEVLDSLSVTCSELRTRWERRIKEEDMLFEKIEQKYAQSVHLHSQLDHPLATTQPAATSEGEYLSGAHQTPPTVVSASFADLESELAALRRQYEGLVIKRNHRLDRRKYLGHGRATTTFGVVGTGLAVGQLAAAMACSVM